MKTGKIKKENENEKVKKTKKTRKKIHEIDSTNDIRYRGPLTYQHLRIIAWLLMALAQIGVMMSFSLKVFPDGRYYHPTVYTVISILSSMALPLFLMANFSVILSSDSNFKKLLIRFGALTGGVIVAFFYVYERFIIGVLAIDQTRAAAKEEFGRLMSQHGCLTFNLFLDLFLCTLVMFFLIHEPKKFFVGKKRIIFRLFSLIPILYDAFSVVLKALANMGQVKVSPVLYPFLTTKPPIMFLVFVALALFIKRRERHFVRNGKTTADYRAFLRTNSNSLHFSIHAAVIMAVAAVIDFLVLVIIGAVLSAPAQGTEEYSAVIIQSLLTGVSWGFGQSISLIFAAPLMLLFSYTRKPRWEKLNMLIPIAGVALIVVEYFEAAFFVITHLS